MPQVDFLWCRKSIWEKAIYNVIFTLYHADIMWTKNWTRQILPIFLGFTNPRLVMISTNSSLDLVNRGLCFNSSPTVVTVAPKKTIRVSASGFWLVHCVVWICCDLSERILWFWKIKRCTNRYNHALGTVCNPLGGKGSCFSLTRTVFLDFLRSNKRCISILVKYQGPRSGFWC